MRAGVLSMSLVMTFGSVLPDRRAHAGEHSQQAPYGAAEAVAFLDKVLSAARDVTVQVAHMAPAGCREIARNLPPCLL